ncbi:MULTISPECIES: anthranilate 1,2-dioxygenase small subunit AndAd [Sphingomonadaceae]|uniref:AntAd n=1 Tax=Sphingomonas sp. XLDN2-5 TaxID=411925 RepID=D5IGH1_9SPHN|nr:MULTISPECIES: anthranilate 1,2-dioxygenase small subunit AndAd [Sphingomonadaceae]ADC31805.1 AntAd [Sphingomonas sp. XLDN2-5]MEA3541770.1 anthranilate 1,2-dioxygenase small subunit AndAd [Pseudomonadota bacterium]QDK35554.1 anthranilate 1,2-dioxygenase [Sphingomonas sp. IC081]QSR20439.1 anthranilate 1,2-dioxygenase [Novosphingobium sp. KA1]BAF03248.1 anthranilate dioxygenase small subunit [Novosphingobium sp. KA1]
MSHALRAELMALQDEYISTLDTDRLEDWPTMFVEDCFYEIIPKENVDQGLPAPIIYCDSKKMLRDRVVSLRHANIYAAVIYRHFVSGLTFAEQPDGSIEMQSSYLVINTSQLGESVVYQTGRYNDVVVREDGRLRFKKKQCVYDTSRVQTLLALPI